MMTDIDIVEARQNSPEFDRAYDVLSRDIPPDFLEEREFLRNRLRVRDRGPETERERILVQEGYTLHLLAARHRDTVIGAVYGHVISRITPGNSAVGFVTYIAVLEEYRKKGVGSLLMDRLGSLIEHDSVRLTGKPVLGMIYEVEAEGKEEIKGYLRKRFAAPLDITYYQPAVRAETEAEPMQFWFQPLSPPSAKAGDLGNRTYPAAFVVSMVTNLLIMEYIGPDLKGFDLESSAYTGFLKSVNAKSEIRFLTGAVS